MNSYDGQMDLSGKLIIKVQLGDDIRRIPIHNVDITYDELVLMMQRVYRGKLGSNDDITIKYKDEDEDLITIFDSSDLSFAIQCSRILKLTLFVNGLPRPLESDEVKYIRRELKELRNRINHLLDILEPPATGVSDEGDTAMQNGDPKSKRQTSINCGPAAGVAHSKEFDPLSAQRPNEENTQNKVMSSFGLSSDGPTTSESPAQTPVPAIPAAAAERAGTPDSVSSISSSASNQYRMQQFRQQQQQQQLQQQQQQHQQQQTTGPSPTPLPVQPPSHPVNSSTPSVPLGTQPSNQPPRLPESTQAVAQGYSGHQMMPPMGYPGPQNFPTSQHYPAASIGGAVRHPAYQHQQQPPQQQQQQQQQPPQQQAPPPQQQQQQPPQQQPQLQQFPGSGVPGQQFSQQHGSGPPCTFVGTQPGPNPNIQNFAYQQQQQQQQQSAPQQQQAPNQTYNPYQQGQGQANQQYGFNPQVSSATPPPTAGGTGGPNPYARGPGSYGSAYPRPAANYPQHNI